MPKTPHTAARINMEKVEQLVEKTKQEWINANLKDVAGTVTKILNGRMETLIAQLLGLSNHWSRREWEVDHCNGRDGNSFLGVEIKAEIRERVSEIVVEAVKDVQLTKQQVAAIQKEYRDQLGRAVAEAARRRAEQDADDLVDSVLTGAYEPAEDPGGERTRRPSTDVFEDDDEDDDYDEDDD